MKQKYIYLLQNPSDPQWFKCGETTDPDGRLKTFQTGYPSSIQWYGLWLANGLSDKQLHPKIAAIAGERRSEWFKGDVYKAAELISRASLQASPQLTIDKAKYPCAWRPGIYGKRFSPEPPPLNDFCQRLAARFNYDY